jgi:hypothetical protein
MCYGDRSRERTTDQAGYSAEETEESSGGIVGGPVRALKRAYALLV